MPLPAAWANGHLYEDIRSQWTRFLDQLSELQSKQCLSPKALFIAANRIAESVPVLVNDALFFKYSFGSGGFVTLTSGMRLHVDRSVFRDAPGRAETVANYLGERIVDYRIVNTANGELALKLSDIRKSASLHTKSGSQFPDATLAPNFSGARSIRLFLFTLFVPTREHRTALLIEASNPEELNRETIAIMKDPGIPCNQIVSPGIGCVSLDGTASMSVDMNVTVNGKINYFPIGSTVESALDGVPQDRQAEAFKTLRIQRLFRGKYSDLEFNHDDPAVSKLPLFAGDRLSWKISQ